MDSSKTSASVRATKALLDPVRSLLVDLSYYRSTRGLFYLVLAFVTIVCYTVISRAVMQQALVRR